MKCLLGTALFLVLFSSCSEEKPKTYSKLDLMSMAFVEDPNIKEVLPKDINSGFKCKANDFEDYGEGCITGFEAEVKNLSMVLVEYETEDQARMAAFRLNAFYARNWIFDDVTGEPALEDFLLKVVVDAKNPRREK